MNVERKFIENANDKKEITKYYIYIYIDEDEAQKKRDVNGKGGGNWMVERENRKRLKNGNVKRVKLRA